MFKLMKNIFSKLYNYMFSLQSDKEIYKALLFVRIEIFHSHYYFGPFYSIEKIDYWLDQSHLRHFNYELIDVVHPDLPRVEWPF